MPCENEISKVFGLPKEVSLLFKLFLSDSEISALLALSNLNREREDQKNADFSFLEEFTDDFNLLLGKDLVYMVGETIILKKGIESLWALLLNAVGKNTYILSSEFNSVKKFIRNYYLEAVKEDPDQYRIFPLREAFLPKYRSSENQDNILELLENAETIVQRPCRCREVFQNCLRPTNTCLVLNDPMSKEIEHGKAKFITMGRAREILRSSLRNGNVLVLHNETPEDPKARMELHSCCSCCSVLLGAIKDSAIGQAIQLPKLFAEVDPSKCNGCATCKEVCMFGARRLVGGVCYVDYSLCVGCGLCVPWCTEQAVRMVHKEAP
ncbi:MAG: hypothetical protein ACFFB3_17475 [Candidatus Hodarchaeota archaeon]